MTRPHTIQIACCTVYYSVGSTVDSTVLQCSGVQCGIPVWAFIVGLPYGSFVDLRELPYGLNEKARVFPMVFNKFCFNALVILYVLMRSLPRFRLALENTLWGSTVSTVRPQCGVPNVGSSAGLQCRFQCEVPLGAPLWGSSARRQCRAIL